MPGRRVLIVTDDVLTMRMAGPAIRAWQIASALSAAGHDVVLATTSPTCERESESFETVAADAERFADLERWCEVFLFQGYVLEHVPPLLAQTEKVMVVDLYDPLHTEALELNRWRPEPERSANVASSVRVLGQQVLRGDYFVCASDKQRDLWMGFLSAAGRVNPANYERDPSLRMLIDVVPFGLPDEEPVHDRDVLKGVVDGIGPGDDVILWGGGVYDWFDPRTAVRAVDILRRRRPGVRLYFMGVRHPNPAIEESERLVQTRALSAELGLTGTHVFFNDGWVAYEDRHNYLLEADIAISLHAEHVEAAYSFRTRILDYLWAGLPIVATRGDTFAEVIERTGVGRVVPGEDPEAVAAAIESLLSNTAERDACRSTSRQVATGFAWSKVLAPLVSFVSEARPAADRGLVEAWPAAPRPAPLLPAPEPIPARQSRWRRIGGATTTAWKRGGPGAVAAGAGRAVVRKGRR